MDEVTSSRCIVVAFGPDLIASSLPCVLRLLIFSNDWSYVSLFYCGLSTQDHQRFPRQENCDEVESYSMHDPIEAPEVDANGLGFGVGLDIGFSADSEFGSKL